MATKIQFPFWAMSRSGKGSLVFNTSPTLVAPILGTPESGNLANCTFPILNQNTTGSSGSCTGNAATVTGLSVTTGKTLTANDTTTLATDSITFAGTEVLTLAATKNVTFADAFITSGAFSITLTADAITTLTLPASGIVATMANIAAIEEVKIIPMSFETGEQTTTRIYFPKAVTINKIRSIVMKALAATDAGTITCGNSVGASTGGVVTVALSAALNVENSATPTTNNTVAADSYYYLTSAKTTAGGKVLVTLEYTNG